ncbi:MAG: type II toxin-antitoxin system VapC family toxin [Planctomycetota bacterium]|jgi:PIN domain nuclease of toxin-antitoxin system
MYEQRLILDTCALLWLTSGDKRLTKEILDAIETAQIVLVSSISAWEISLKVERKQLKLPQEPAVWFEKVITHHNLMLAPLDIGILTEANKLPWHHKDPADRFIISTAMKEKAAIITADKKFFDYDAKVIEC